MVERYAVVTAAERRILESFRRPIVLLGKRADLPGVAPGLHSVGVLLPYTGVHHLLFQDIDEPLVMSSANLPGRPIIHEEADAETLGADAVLSYNRAIHQRCDDSVVRVVGGRPLLIRRSRGYVPEGVPCDCGNLQVLATGAEENVTACLTKDGYAYLSQHIGHLTRPETLAYFEDAVAHLGGLLSFFPQAVVCDRHPDFLTTRFAEAYAAERNVPLTYVQHHHAHIAGVMAEHDLSETVGIAIDGFGYGDDGQAWGGEILTCTRAEYARFGHLQAHPMPGGDRATRYPLRLAAGILGDEARDMLLEKKESFPYGEREVEVVLRQVRKASMVTTSCGRLLDAAAGILGVCHEMRYEGEPAMKLEAAAAGGRNALSLEPQVTGTVLDTKFLFRALVNNRHHTVRDLAYAVEEYVACGLATVAIDAAETHGITDIAVAGGCCYNEHILGRLRECIEAAGCRFHVGQKVPCGDGGVAFGQAAVVAARNAES
jgi:hydrogenase maturation protein HypF